MKGKFAVTASLTAVSIMILYLIVSAINPNIMSNLFADEKIGADKAPVTLSEPAKILNNAMQSVSNAVVPTVVSIKVKMKKSTEKNPFNDEFQEFFKFFGQPFEDDGPVEGGGSGVFVTPTGYIITNNHVVENANDIVVTTDDKKEYKAKLIGTDPSTDLAVIKIEVENMPYVHLGDMDNVKVGEMVIAVGNPLGLNSTVTAGIVSAIGRGSLALVRDKNGYGGVENFIQTDAAINPGNSGGGLFNLEGSLIGINNAIATRTGTYIGYGFAIPVDIVKAVVSDIIRSGKVTRAYIGVQIRSLDEVMAKSLGMEKVEGALVNDVVKNSPGEKAGIEPGDVILNINGKELKSSNELQAEVVKHKVGESVTLKIWRDGKLITKTVKLEARDADDIASNDEAVTGDDDSQETGKTLSFDKLGFSVDNLTKKQKDDYNVDKGVIITKVERNSVALDRGILPEGIITKADRQQVSSPKELKRIIESKKSGDALMLNIKYKDTNRIIAVEIP